MATYPKLSGVARNVSVVLAVLGALPLAATAQGYKYETAIPPGIAVPDNQNTLRPSPHGPALLEDFILREKITHFDHERIPERVVHARGSAAHGFFELTHSLAD